MTRRQTKRGGNVTAKCVAFCHWCCNANLCHCETEMHFYWIMFYYRTKTVEPAKLPIMCACSAVTTFLYVNSSECLGHCVFSFFLCRRRKETKPGLGLAFKMLVLVLLLLWYCFSSLLNEMEPGRPQPFSLKPQQLSQLFCVTAAEDSSIITENLMGDG